MLEREVRRRDTSTRFLGSLKKLNASPLRPMTPEEISTEIKAYRQGKRKKREGRR